MRLGEGGVVLAANDAALMLLGMQSGQQALGRAFAAWIPPEQRDRWHAFTAQVIGGSPSSIECDIIDVPGNPQATLLHGVPLADHPDGLPSMVVAARAVSGQRQLEAAVLEREAVLRELEAEREDARARLAEARDRQRQLEGALHALESRVQADLDARARELDAAVAACAVAEATCQQALADRCQGEAALEELTAQHEQLTTERAAERRRVLELLEAIAVQHREELLAARNAPERQRLLAALDEREAAIRQLETARAAVQAELQAARDDRRRLDASMQEADARHQAREQEMQQQLAALQLSEQDTRQQRDDCQAQLNHVQGACLQLQTTLGRQETAHRELAAEHAAVADERNRLARHLAEQAVRFTALATHGRQLMPLAFAGRAARDIASRLRQHLERVDDFATGMLVNGSLDHSVRPAMEHLRGEAAQASALADEILAGVDGHATAESDHCPLVSGDERRS